MFTDMVGYTASTQVNEAEALRSLQEQEEIVRPLLKGHEGREIKSTGDGFLVEFDSALRAVQCAIEIHQRLHERNSQRGPPPIRLRIGVHLGDVEERGDDIFGDSVNIAARIEPFAEPGGICISDSVFGQVRNKIPNRLEKLEPKILKNVRFPVDLYRVVLPWTVREPPSPSLEPTGLAVLPFTNISPDPKDEYFADGLSEELITVLCRMRELRVIARTSVMQYKTATKPVSQIGAELGVTTILEGSVRKAGSRLRIAAQLIDVASQGHIWANTYDRELDDVFAVQVDIAKQVAEALKVELRPAEATRLAGRPAVRPDSYLAYLKGRTLLHAVDRASLEAAKKQFDLAISLDPTNAAAHSGLADIFRLLGSWYPDVAGEGWDETTRRLVARAIELDPNLAEAHASLGMILWDEFQYPAAEREFKLALSLNPSYSLAHEFYAALLEDEGRAGEALLEYALAEAADPLGPLKLLRVVELLTWLGRLDEALVKIQKLGEVEHEGQLYHVALAHYYLARSERARCLEEIRQAEELEREPRTKLGWRAWYSALSGEPEQARALLRHEETLPEFFPTTSLNIVSYAELGDLDACFRLLERGVKSHRLSPLRFRFDPRLEPLRSDPRFQVVLQELNLA